MCNVQLYNAAVAACYFCVLLYVCHANIQYNGVQNAFRQRGVKRFDVVYKSFASECERAAVSAPRRSIMDVQCIQTFLMCISIVHTHRILNSYKAVQRSKAQHKKTTYRYTLRKEEEYMNTEKKQLKSFNVGKQVLIFTYRIYHQSVISLFVCL